MFPLLLPLLFLSASLPQDSVPQQDSLMMEGVDTLREVTVRAGRHIPLPGMVISDKYKQGVVPPPNLGDVLEKLSPGLKDKIMHPFAIKQRKKERRRKRSLKALEEFGRVKTFDELLQEAYRQQLYEDSLANSH